MPDFRQLLQKPSGEAKKPPVLDAGDYPCIIKGHEMGESSQKKTPFVRFNLGLTGWPDGTDPQPEVDLTKRQLRTDFYITEDALYRLDEFLRSCGMELSGRTYEEVLPEVTGAHCLANIKQELNQQTNEIFNRVDKLVGVQ